MSLADANDASPVTADAAAEAASSRAGARSEAISKLRLRDVRQFRMAQSLSQVVAVLMRDPSYRALPIGDLEWLVLPPVMAGQFRIGQTRAATGNAPGEQGGILLPVAVALWARVSDEIDHRLSTTLDTQARIKPDQWASGKHLWLMAVGGEPRMMPRFLAELRDRDFAGQDVKIRFRDKDGKVEIKTLAEIAGSAASTAAASQPAIMQ